MRAQIRKRLLPFLAGLVLFLLVAKYFWSLYLFPEVPFGYDAGIYRYLFIRHAIGLAPFDTANMAPWARAHAPGLFFISSLLMRFGMTADMLIGGVWNIIPVVLACVLAFVIRKRHGDLAGFFVLVAALLSTVQYEGFLMMYYKTLVALLWCALAFSYFESGSILWMLFGMFAIATHQQIGLILIVAIGSSLVSLVVLKNQPISLRRCGEFVLTIGVGLLWYLPTYERSLQDIAPKFLASGTLLALSIGIIVVGGFSALIVWLPQKNKRYLWVTCAAVCVILLSLLPVVLDSPGILSRLLVPRTDTASGAFLSLAEYLKLSFPLLLAGVVGLVLSLEHERGTPWQWATVWCAVASLGMFFFYRRFLLPLDFFLLPFVAIACTALLQHKKGGRMVLALLLVLQAGLLIHHISRIDPVVKPEWMKQFAELHTSVPAGSTVIVLDNMAPWVLGYLPDSSVSGPGIFDSLPLSAWEKFLLGSEADRREFFEFYPKGTFFYATDIFRMYYPPEVQSVLQHSCLIPEDAFGLYQSRCGQ